MRFISPKKKIIIKHQAEECLCFLIPSIHCHLLLPLNKMYIYHVVLCCYNMLSLTCFLKCEHNRHLGIHMSEEAASTCCSPEQTVLDWNRFGLADKALLKCTDHKARLVQYTG